MFYKPKRESQHACLSVGRLITRFLIGLVILFSLFHLNPLSHHTVSLRLPVGVRLRATVLGQFDLSVVIAMTAVEEVLGHLVGFAVGTCRRFSHHGGSQSGNVGQGVYCGLGCRCSTARWFNGSCLTKATHCHQLGQAGTSTKSHFNFRSRHSSFVIKTKLERQSYVKSQVVFCLQF